LKDQEAEAQREAQQLRREAKASGEKLEEEKKAKKAELMRIAAERKSEKARRDALEKMKDAKIAELSAKQKRQEAEIAKTEERRQAALKEADAARAKAKAARNEADRAIVGAKRAKNLADRAKRVADQRARRAGIEISRARSQQAQARKRVAKAASDVKKAQAQIRAIGNIGGDPFRNAARYGAVPGYYRRGYRWAGDKFNVSNPNTCKAMAREKGLAVWGHRNALHPNKKYKNSCYFYRSGPKYAGDRNDKIHMIGCTFGGNPRTGCGTPVKKVVKMVAQRLRAVRKPGGQIRAAIGNIAQRLTAVRKAGGQIRAIGNIGGDPFRNAARYGAVPGYYRRGYKFAGDKFNVSDPNTCKAIAKKKDLTVWGHRNALHPNKKYKNSCYFYRSGPKYAGDRNDKIHMIGCTFGGNPRTGCVVPMSQRRRASRRASRRARRRARQKQRRDPDALAWD
jgi:hypothetical protein